MSDSNPPPPPPPPETPPEPMLPAMPSPISFNVQLLEQWLEIPESEQLTIPLTRQDFDNLLFGLLRSSEAQSALEQVLVHWSNGKVDEANKRLLDFKRLNIEGLNNIRQFYSGVMISALRARGHGKK